MNDYTNAFAQWPFSRSEQSNEAFLFEMFVSGQRLANAVFAHQHETYGIAERIGFVLTGLHQCKSCSVQRLINPNEFYHRTVKQLRGKGEVGGAIQSAGIT